MIKLVPQSALSTPSKIEQYRAFFVDLRVQFGVFSAISAYSAV
jgi:hypothetical protein